MKRYLVVILYFVFALSLKAQHSNTITQGPILGHVTDSSVRVWGRTEFPGKLVVVYSEVENNDQAMVEIQTRLENDNTGWATLSDLLPDTRYRYHLETGDNRSPEGSFTTLPASSYYVNESHNPNGLFNFRFEYGSCANQNPNGGLGPSLPTYTTMLNELKGTIHFAVMNGDWLYEEKRDYPASEWLKANGLTTANQPSVVSFAPTVVGVWENYKSYLDKAANLAEWHRHIPSYFTFDDHELVNDLWGAGTAGRRDRRTVFRDIGTTAFYDYLGWANPVSFTQDIHISKAKFKKGSNILIDKMTDFSRLNFNQMGNLHVHWGTTTAGVDDISLDAINDGNPNSMVYDVLEVVSKNKLRISPPALDNGSGSYSIARKSYSKFTVSNSDFFLLDTRTHREWHDIQNRDQPGLTILGHDQRKWLMEEMKKSESDFFFLFSSVPFMIPHIGAGGADMASNKDESWTAFLDEREKLIAFWEELEKPVFVLTGDLHNSFAVKITDHIWEFCSGPHNSVNHRLSDEGDRPKSGLYQFDKREMDIRWSSFVIDDIPRSQRMYPHYCVVQINNVFNNPLQLDGKRWVAYEHPQVIFQFFDGRTGELRYSETISTMRKKKK